MAITDLTNTIWVFGSTFVFSQSGTYSINFTSGGHSYTSIRFANYSSGKYVDYDNTRVFGSTPNTWISQGYRIIKITGGNDVTNSTLIAWFNTVAKQISVEDLSNTSWVFDNDWIYANKLTSKSINFTSNGNNYTEISVSTFHAGDDVYIYYGNTNVYECITDDVTYSWLDNQYRLISITDGIDTNNPDLMLLLANYATLVPVVDLSNTKWVFDDNPQAEADYGSYELIFSSDPIAFTRMGIGYGAQFEPESDNISYGDYTWHVMYNGSSWVDNAYKTIEISNGTDATDPDLIAWLSQNATYQEHTPVTATKKLLKFNNKNLYTLNDSIVKTFNNIDVFCGVIVGTLPVANIISFTIEGHSYQAEEGMTWAEWVNSEYNTDGFVTDDDYVYMSSRWQNVIYGGYNVLASDAIEANGHYTTGGGSN